MSKIRTGILWLGLCCLALPVKAEGIAQLGTAIFLGPDSSVQMSTTSRELSIRHFMTAKEMQTKIRQLTGYYHTGFDKFADLIGRYDPNTGQRTNDQPTVASILFLKVVAKDLAKKVVQREMFLDDEERIVFPGVIMQEPLSSDEFARVFQGLYQQWLGLDLPSPLTADLTELYQNEVEERDFAKGLQLILEVFLQLGGLYYY